MSNTKEVYLTQEGLDKLKEELDYLKLEKRPEVISALKDARALGDLSENAEYDAARNEQAVIEARIKELETILENATVVDSSSITGKEVSIGTCVTVQFVEDDEEEVYTLVGTKEADVFENKISTKSPIAVAIMGKKVGEKATVKCDAGDYDVIIKDIKIAQ